MLVDLRPRLRRFKTKAEKRAALEIAEGKWQTQLRTMTRYGGLNKKDNRKISNQKSATSFNKSKST